MAGWGGFTDEELRTLKEESSSGIGKHRQMTEVASLTQGCKGSPKEKVFLGHTRKEGKKSVTRDKKEILEPVESPSKVVATDVSHVPVDEKPFIPSSCTQKEKHLALDGGTGNQSLGEASAGCTSNDTKVSEEAGPIRLLSNEETSHMELLTLEELQLKQKQMEEENKKRKKLIKDTLQERYKRAQSETQTLQTINKELLHLDELLATDVEILRTKIEEATINFAHAQRRYDKAEKEFVDAKLNLQLRSNKKEDLTQHLYSIIKENEERKAKKLEDLMSKLNLPREDRTHPDV